MAGSDRVPGPDDSKRAQVEKRKPSTRAKWRSSNECTQKCAQTVLDTADIVRDGIFRQLTAKEIPDRILRSHHTER